MPLADVAIRSAKPPAKTVRLFDASGLYLEMSPAGGRWWRWKYRFAGREKRLALGAYPEISLKEARTKRDDARRQLAAGIDPGWVASHGDRILRRLEADIFPWLGRRAIAEIKAPEVLAVIRRVESRETLTEMIAPPAIHLPAVAA